MSRVFPVKLTRNSHRGMFDGQHDWKCKVAGCPARGAQYLQGKHARAAAELHLALEHGIGKLPPGSREGRRVAEVAE